MKFKFNQIAQASVFSALAFVGGYLFIAVPNVEIFTAVVFLAGYFLGSKWGMVVGLISQALFSVLNPYGVSPPPLFVAQVLNRMIVGYVGGIYNKDFGPDKSYWITALRFGFLGLILTVLYDFMTDYSFFVVSGFSWEQMKTTFTLGSPFYLLHGISNVIIFAVVLPVFIRVLKRDGNLNPAERT